MLALAAGVFTICLVLNYGVLVGLFLRGLLIDFDVTPFIIWSVVCSVLSFLYIKL